MSTLDGSDSPETTGNRVYPGVGKRLARNATCRRCGAHAADLRVLRLLRSRTNARFARSAARRITRISATWIAGSLDKRIPG
jgi:hypothetical protein